MRQKKDKNKKKTDKSRYVSAFVRFVIESKMLSPDWLPMDSEYHDKRFYSPKILMSWDL